MATATTKAPPKRFALYLEARPIAGNDKEIYTRQILVMPPHRDTATREWSWPALLHRSVAPTNPRAQWRFAPIHASTRYSTFSPAVMSAGITVFLAHPEGVSTHFMKLVEQRSLLEDRPAKPDDVADDVFASGGFAYIMDWINAQIGKPDILTVHGPYFIEVTDKDASDTYEKRTPSAMIRRLDRVRKDAGLPESLTEPVGASLPSLTAAKKAVTV